MPSGTSAVGGRADQSRHRRIDETDPEQTSASAADPHQRRALIEGLELSSESSAIPARAKSRQCHATSQICDDREERWSQTAPSGTIPLSLGATDAGAPLLKPIALGEHHETSRHADDA
jgi:hypothetical protein